MELAVKALKYFLLSLAGCTVTYVVSVVLEIDFLSDLASIVLEQVFTRALILLICLIAIAVIIESLRY